MSKFVLTAQLQLQAPNNVRQVVNQIQNQLRGGINVDINAQGSAQAQRQIKNVTDETNKATNAATRMGKAFGLSIKRFAGLAIATRAVSLFTNTLGGAIKDAIAFERELIKISQVTGKTISQLKDLTNTITRLSTGLGVSSTELLKTSRILSQAGFSARDAEIALDALAKTDLAPTFENIIDTTEGAVAIFNQFKQGAAALEAQLSSINAVAGKFAVEAGDLITVIRRTGGVFKAAGGDLNELIALFTSVRSTTRESAESISTGLKTIFTRIQRPRTIEFLREFGIELEDAAGKFVGPLEAVRQLNEAFAGLEEGDLTFVRVGEEIAGFRQIGKIIPLIREFAVTLEALKVAQEGQDSLAENAATAQLALAVRIGKVQEQFQALVRSISETKTFQLMANTILSLAESLIKLADSIKPVLPLLGALVAIRGLRGIGSFVGGIGRGVGGPKEFARGGIVPGTGNRDSVPAMLTPGEFVIRKSSVAKLGAENLAAMNENRYAVGGTIRRRKPLGMLVREEGEDPQDFVGTKTLSSVKRGTTTIKELKKLANKLGKAITFTAPIDTSKFSKSDSFLKEAEQPILAAFDTAANNLKAAAGSDVSSKDAKNKAKAGLGQLFEDFITSVGGLQKPGTQNFDLIDAGSKLNKHVKENIPPFTDIKLNANQPNADTLVKKAINQGLYDEAASRKMKALQEEAGKKTRRRRRKAVGGGITGTDTVPALLTPGEFVVNRASARSIGYGNLNRMNKVGKYAKGGIVQEFANGTGPTGAQPAGGGGFGLAGLATVAIGATAALDAMRFEITENSSGFARAMNFLIDSTQQVITTLLAFQATLQLMGASDLTGAFKGLGLTVNRFGRRLDGFGGGPIRKLGVGISKSAAVLSSFTSGVLASVVGIQLVNAGFTAMYSRIEELNARIAGGDQQGASDLAQAEGRLQGGNMLRTVLGTAGAVIGGIAGGFLGATGGLGFGAVPGAAGGAVGGSIVGGGAGVAIATGITAITDDVGDFFTTLFGGITVESKRVQAVALAAQAGANKELADSAEEATDALKQFKEGNIDATELINRTSKGRAAAGDSQKKTADAIETLSKEQSSFFGGVTGNANDEILKLAEANRQVQKRSFDQDRGVRSAVFRRDALRGATSITQSQLAPEVKRKSAQVQDLRTKQAEAEARGDTTAAKVFEEQANAIEDEINTMIKEFNNVNKSVAEARKRFDALNVGMGPAIANANAQAAALAKFNNNLSSSSGPLDNAVVDLESGITSAAQGIDNADYDRSLKVAGDRLLKSGVDPSQVQKFQNVNKALFASQKDFPAIIEGVKDQLGRDDLRGVDASNLEDQFRKATGERLKAQGFDDASIKRIVDGIPELTDEERKTLDTTGDTSIFQKKLEEAGGILNKDVNPALKQLAENDKQLLEVTRKRIEAENNLVAAQQQAIDIFMEAREIEAGAGGAIVTPEERRRSIAARANVSGRRAGLSDLDANVSVDSLRRRNQEIRSSFGATSLSANERAGLTGEQKTNLDEQNNRLRNAQQEQLKTIRALIKVQQDELKTIQEKQRLEQQSIDSLLAGDIDKFFKQQAAQGAIAAAATGDQRLMGAFGAEANAGATKELRRLRDAGVTEMFGQQIGGRGGLLEGTSLAGVQARGLRGPAAERAARIAAGTTDEQLEKERQIRQSAGVLAETGDLGADMAEMSFQTAQMNVQQAQIIVQNVSSQVGQTAQRGEAVGDMFATGRERDEMLNKTTPSGDTNPGRGPTFLKDMLDAEFERMRREVNSGGPRPFDPNVNQFGANQMGVANIIDAESLGGLSQFGSDFKNSVEALSNLSLDINLANTSVNVNLQGGEFLRALTEDLKQQLLSEVSQELKNYRPTSTGMENSGKVLPS